MDKSQVIKYSQMLIPTLEALKTLGGSASINELDARAVEIMNLSDEMNDVAHGEAGSISEVCYRLAWARTYLKKYGLIINSSRGVWSFTEGFNGNPDSYSSEEIIHAVRGMSRIDDPRLQEDDDLENDGVDEPEETKGWREQLRQTLMSIEPDAFERLALRLLRESGFMQVEVTGKPNDHGIDGKGIIRLNGIVSFHMMFQCKRYRGKVCPSEIRDFRGAMQGRADKGLFITTGSFTAEARREATRDGAPAIDLIDGDELVDMLKELGLGVSEKIVKQYEVDEKWFKSL